MISTSDLNKQAQEVIFSKKTKKLLHPSILFSNISLKKCYSKTSQKHLGLTLDVKVNLVQLTKNIT